MNVQQAIQQMANNPPTVAVGNILKAYVDVVRQNPPPADHSTNIINALQPYYTNAIYGISLAYVISILKANNIGANLPEPNNANVVVALLAPPAQQTTYGTTSAYTGTDTNSEMSFGDDPHTKSSATTNNSPYSLESVASKVEASNVVQAVTQTPVNIPLTIDTTIYTLSELIRSNKPLVSNCIYVPIEDYRDRINLTVAVPFDFDIAHPTDLSYIVDFTKHTFCDDIVNTKDPRYVPMNELWSSKDPKEIVSVMNRRVKTKEDRAYIRHVMFINNIYNKLINLTLSMCGSSMVIDNGVIDYKDLIEYLSNKDEEYTELRVKSALDALTANREMVDVDDPDGKSTLDTWNHSVKIINVDSLSVELGLLLATVPMKLDEVVHRNIISSLERVYQYQEDIVILRATDNDFLVINDGAHFTVASMDFVIP